MVRPLSETINLPAPPQGGTAPAGRHASGPAARCAPSRDRVDAQDRSIVSLLLRNPRLSSESLSRALNMTPRQVDTSIARLERIGALRGCRAVVSSAVSDVDPGARAGGTGTFLAVTAVRSAEFTEAVQSLGHGDSLTVHTVAGRCNTVIRISGSCEIRSDVTRLLDDGRPQGQLSGRLEVAVVQKRYDKVHGPRHHRAVPTDSLVR
ncbi:AsnC family transcriptional regulator [Streptomyces sp. enrichment culture]|uniref:AsnC family transcriptional regulator n=1 Tax=Streptomyces sp. enrichment culture TaxID=1795815 RepID=UPI003F571A8B